MAVKSGDEGVLCQCKGICSDSMPSHSLKPSSSLIHHKAYADILLTGSRLSLNNTQTFCKGRLPSR